MEKINTAYLICDSRNFLSLDDSDEAEKEYNRVRAKCYRMKNKIGTDDIHFLLGLSNVNSDFFGEMGYDKPKNQGGKKQFKCIDKIRRLDSSTGEIVCVMPNFTVFPHIHILVEGYGASSCAERILNDLRKRNDGNKFSKTHLKSAERVTQVKEYITRQSILLRRV